MGTNPSPCRGEVWRVRFDPSVEPEQKKVRPAVVISEDAVGRLPLRLVVPITDWKPHFAHYPWFVHLSVTLTNGLTKESGADAFQVKSIPERRFVQKLGILPSSQLDLIAAAVAICVGAN